VSPTGEPIQFTASVGLLHDCLIAAPIDAAENLAEATQQYTERTTDLNALRRAFERVLDHHALLAAHEQEATDRG
jgi:hypothetical protein